MTTPERGIEEIVEETKTNFYKRYSDKAYPKELTSIVNELSKDFTQTLQAERQKYKEMVGQIRLLIAKYAKEDDMDVSGLVNEINALCK